jgi:hypothetical protein
VDRCAARLLLERVTLGLVISGIGEVVCALSGWDCIEDRTDGILGPHHIADLVTSAGHFLVGIPVAQIADGG